MKKHNGETIEEMNCYVLVQLDESIMSAQNCSHTYIKVNAFLTAHNLFHARQVTDFNALIK